MPVAGVDRGRPHADQHLVVADAGGVDALSMGNLAQRLGVVPMALYKHVANKDELLDGMVDVVVGEIDPPADGIFWKAAIRQRVLSARSALLRHPVGVPGDRVACSATWTR
jgi:AcrR family transcriptional regulator